MGQSALDKSHFTDILRDEEKLLKNYRFIRGSLRKELDEFFDRLPEPQRTFARLRYKEGYTMENISEKMNYSPRTMYIFRTKILEWWSLFSRGEDVRF